MEHGDSGFSNEDRRHFLKQIGIFVIGTGMFSESSQNLLVLPSRRKSLPRSSPESQGVSSSEILEFILEAEKRNAGLHSVMIIRHGRVVAEGWWAPYQADIKHGLFSLSKNFTATAIGLAIQEGKLSLEDKVVSFFPEDLPEKVDENLAAMRVRDLITMSGGHGSDTLFPLLNTKSGTWAKTFLSIPLKYKPGTRFVYNTGSTYPLPDLLKIGLIHYQFETVHPFLDGNGRVGRLLITLYLIDRGILKQPILYLSDYFERNRTLYYDNLMRARTHNDINQWLKFFLVGIIEISKIGVTTFNGILQLQKTLEIKIQSFGSRAGEAKKIVAYLYEQPVIDASRIEAITGKSKATNYKLLADLERMEILKEVSGGQRNKLYVFNEYLDLFR